MSDGNSRNQHNFLRIFAAHPPEKKCKGSQASEIDACLRLCQSLQFTYFVDIDVVGMGNATVNDASAESLSQPQTKAPKVEPPKKLGTNLVC